MVFSVPVFSVLLYVGDIIIFYYTLAEFHMMLLSVILWINSLPVFISDLVPVSVGKGKFIREVHRAQKSG